MKLRRLLVFFPLLFSFTLAAQTAGEVEITAEPTHHLALQNQYVRVFQVEVAPQTATLMHWHRHDYVFVTIGATEISNEVKGKSPVTLKLQDGEVEFAPGPFAHVARDLASTPFRNVTVEFLQDEQAHKTPPPKWDEERGLDILEGGTRHILFVKDGVRASDIELQPGGMLPEREHAGPCLLVAVSAMDLREMGDKGSATTQKPGGIHWISGSSRALMNVGKQPVRFITLEFH
jgi:hypothetical protein